MRVQQGDRLPAGGARISKLPECTVIGTRIRSSVQGHRIGLVDQTKEVVRIAERGGPGRREGGGEAGRCPDRERAGHRRLHPEPRVGLLEECGHRPVGGGSRATGVGPDKQIGPGAVGGRVHPVRAARGEGLHQVRGGSVEGCCQRRGEAVATDRS